MATSYAVGSMSGPSYSPTRASSRAASSPHIPDSLIAGVRGTTAIFQATPDEPLARFWLVLLLFFDVVFVTLALWTFEPLMTE